VYQRNPRNYASEAGYEWYRSSEVSTAPALSHCRITCRDRRSAWRIGSGTRYCEQACAMATLESSDSLCPADTYTGFLTPAVPHSAAPQTYSRSQTPMRPQPDSTSTSSTSKYLAGSSCQLDEVVVLFSSPSHHIFHIRFRETVDMEEGLADANGGDVLQHSEVRRKAETLRMQDAVAVHQRHVWQ
jgi:hypothetical protein